MTKSTLSRIVKLPYARHTTLSNIYFITFSILHCTSSVYCLGGRLRTQHCCQSVGLTCTNFGLVVRHISYHIYRESDVLPPCGLVRDCSRVDDGSYPDYEHDCRSYYTCNHHTYFGHNFCSAGNIYHVTITTSLYLNWLNYCVT